MFETNNNRQIKPSSERNFAIVFCIFFALIGLYPLLIDKNINLWACLLSFLFLFLGIIFPKSLTLPNKLWFKFGIFLSKLTSPIILALIYYLTITPVGIVIRFLGKDLIKQKIILSKKSYWIKRKEQVGSMKNQY